MKLEFLEEGYYREGDDQYMSIWTYKRKNGMTPNDTGSNYEDAKNMTCYNRKWLPFNQSNRFKEGWHYDLGYLVTFYGHN
jgi:hypothetical protein